MDYNSLIIMILRQQFNTCVYILLYNLVQETCIHVMTSSDGNIFRVTGPLCGEFTGHGEFPAQRPVTRSFGVVFDLRLNIRLSKQSWGWWFETPSRSLWRHCNDFVISLNLLWFGSTILSYVIHGYLFEIRKLYKCPNASQKHGWW